MTTIWKFPLPERAHVIELPRKHRFLTAQMQQDVPTVWAEVEPDGPTIKRAIYAVGTGQIVLDDTEYLATVQAGPMVWHIYYSKYCSE